MSRAAKVLELRLEVGGNEEGTDTQTHVHNVGCAHPDEAAPSRVTTWNFDICCT